MAEGVDLKAGQDLVEDHNQEMEEDQVQRMVAEHKAEVQMEEEPVLMAGEPVLMVEDHRAEVLTEERLAAMEEELAVMEEGHKAEVLTEGGLAPMDVEQQIDLDQDPREVLDVPVRMIVRIC